MTGMVGSAVRSLSGGSSGKVVGHPVRRLIVGHWEKLLVATLLIVSALMHGINIFHYPHYEVDEGTYMGSAWAMFERGELSYYTYNYDHPILGWFQIGTWANLFGGFLSFGTSINTGRTMMLAIAVISTLLIYLIVRRATGQPVAAFGAALFFAVSPLGVSLHRQVWLDNIATLWLLASIYLLLSARESLWRMVMSAVAFGLMFWSKEIFAIFLPGMLYMVFTQSHRAHRRFAFALWGAVAATAMSFFGLLALLKDELLPPGVLWSSTQPHVSLVETLLFQASRGSAVPPGPFDEYFKSWAETDPVLILGGSIAVALGIVLWRNNRALFGQSILALVFLLFNARGGVVLYHYVIPLLALLAVALGIFAGFLLARLALFGRHAGRVAALAVLAVTVVVGVGQVQANAQNFESDSTSVQNDAARWVADNIPSDSVIIMDSYPWVDLRDPSFTGGDTFKHAHYYWPAQLDPEIRKDFLDNDWRNVDYLLLSASTAENIAKDSPEPLPLVKSALSHAEEIRTFKNDDYEMRVFRVNERPPELAISDPMLAETWTDYKGRFIESGRVIDPASGGQTTSEGQAYAMLRAVYMDDREAFDEVWNWTQQNLQREDRLLAWQESFSDGAQDRNSATDGDTDTALALLFAARRWYASEYQREALGILDGVWEQETAVVDGRRVLVAGDWARGDGGSARRAVVNPSYFSPHAYRIFAEADRDHDWMQLVDSSYGVLDSIGESDRFGGQAGLAPDWISLDTETGDLLSAEKEVPGADRFSYDASRLPWRLSLDWLWFQDERAKGAMGDLDRPRRELERGGAISPSYALDGTPLSSGEEVSMYSGVVPGLLLGDEPALAQRVFKEKVEGTYVSDAGSPPYWGDNPDDYYDQNMAWFSTAVMHGWMSNLWEDETQIDWKAAGLEGCPAKCGEAAGTPAGEEK